MYFKLRANQDDANRLQMIMSKLPIDVSEALANSMKEGGDLIRDYIRDILISETHVDGSSVTSVIRSRTGKLRKSIYVRRDKDKISVFVRQGEAFYAKWQNEGYNKGGLGWDITPKHRKSLKFFWEQHGIWMVRKKVHHKGLKARHFLELGLAQNRVKVIEIARRHIKEAIANV